MKRELTGQQRQLLDIWEQDKIPVIRRRIGHDLRVRLPYSDWNREWLQALGRNRPQWNRERKCWEVPRAWLKRLIEKCLQDFRQVYIVQPHREQEVCAPACRNATGYECECSCMGANHGSNDSDRSWRDVSETFSTRWGAEEIAARLLQR